MQNFSESQLLDLFRIIADEAILGYLVFCTTKKDCLYVNKLARELFEFPEDLETKSFELENLFVEHPRGDYQTFGHEMVQHEGLYQDVLLKKSNGHVFIANVGVKQIQFQEQNILLLMIQDITIQKKLQRDITAKQIEIKSAFEELLKQNKQLKELDLAKNRFIALTTHELRTPLSAMVASAEILQLGLYDNDTQLKEFIDMIYDQGLHLQELVNDILDFAKIQAGKMDFYIESDSPIALLQSLVEGFESMAENSNVSVELDAAPSECLCYYDDLRLRQVLSNIINNAIKYNRTQGTVKVWLEEDSEWVRVYVKDSGKGIAKDQLDMVFNEFETLGKVAQHHKGTGLGMPISRRLMEGMGGTIRLESELGVGTTFWIEIPKNQVLAADLYRPRPDGVGDLVA